MLAVFSRYLAVQIAAYCLDMGFFLLASTVMGWSVLVSNIGAKILAGAFAFFSHRRVTFNVHDRGGSHVQVIKYVVLLSLNVPLSSAALMLLLPWVSPDYLAKFLADAACIGITFLLSRYLVFTPPKAGGPP